MREHTPFHDPTALAEADPIDRLEQSITVDLDQAIEDYGWVRRDEVLEVAGRRFFI